MTKIFLLISLFSCLLYLPGCSFTPLKYMPASSTIETNDTKQPLIDPNTGPLKITIAGRRIISFDTKPIIKLKEPCRIKYNPFFPSDRSVVVSGQLPNGTECRVMIDTGFPGFCVLS